MLSKIIQSQKANILQESTHLRYQEYQRIRDREWNSGDRSWGEGVKQMPHWVRTGLEDSVEEEG